MAIFSHSMPLLSSLTSIIPSQVYLGFICSPEHHASVFPWDTTTKLFSCQILSRWIRYRNHRINFNPSSSSPIWMSDTNLPCFQPNLVFFSHSRNAPEPMVRGPPLPPTTREKLQVMYFTPHLSYHPSPSEIITARHHPCTSIESSLFQQAIQVRNPHRNERLLHITSLRRNPTNPRTNGIRWKHND